MRITHVHTKEIGEAFAMNCSDYGADIKYLVLLIVEPNIMLGRTP